MKDYIEERAVEIADYIIETKATVRQTAKKFGSVSLRYIRTVPTVSSRSTRPWRGRFGVCWISTSRSAYPGWNGNKREVSSFGRIRLQDGKRKISARETEAKEKRRWT